MTYNFIINFYIIVDKGKTGGYYSNILKICYLPDGKSPPGNLEAAKHEPLMRFK